VAQAAASTHDDGRGVDEAAYRRGIRAWVTYDWANSAFTVTVVTAVLPVYFSSVAGATLPSPARATQLFSLVTSIALALTAVLSPLLGAYSDLMAAKKRILAVLVGVGAITTGAMWLVTEGDWVLALVLFAIGRIAFSMGNVLYDALLPSVARPPDQDTVSARGFAFGYLGGGLLLAVNVGMIFGLGAERGSRLSFVTVAIWWAVFTIPLLRHVPEPPPTLVGRRAGVGETVRQTVDMVRSLAHMPDLRRFLVSYLVYNDAINVVIAVAALYGAELGFGTEELLLAVLLVQFTAGPYAILFGRLATRNRANRGRIGVFLVANIVLVPLVGILLGLAGPGDIVGRADDPFQATGDAVGQGEVDLAARLGDQAAVTTIAADLVAADEPVEAVVVDDEVTLAYVGRDVVVGHASGPGGGTLAVSVDGRAGVDADGEAVRVDTASDRVRYGEEVTAVVADAGPHTLTLSASGGPVTVQSLEVAPPPRDANLPLILGVLLGIQVVAGVAMLSFGRAAAARARRIDARRGIILALCAYVVVAVWGFTLDTVMEFWALAWLVSVVQGGSQALSRSLYTTLVPERRAGEFFGMFSILSKFASFLSPLLFVVSVAIWDSSRPAVLALAVMFLTGIGLLRRVDPTTGQALARRLDADVTVGGPGPSAAPPPA